jgi:hypothetical protein
VQRLPALSTKLVGVDFRQKQRPRASGMFREEMLRPEDTVMYKIQTGQTGQTGVISDNLEIRDTATPEWTRSCRQDCV